MTATDAILGHARAHFERLRGQRVEVPEWGDDAGPLVVHFDPLSLRARQRLDARAGKVAGGDVNRGRLVALVVILHARGADGALLFEDNAETLAAMENRVDPAVVARIAAAILATSAEGDLGN